MNEPPQLLTEAGALRACNLPATQQWRQWLRGKVASQELTTGRVYNRSQVEAIAAAIRPGVADIVLPPEPEAAPAPTPRAVPSGLQHGPPIRGEKALTNRIAAPLHTR